MKKTFYYFLDECKERLKMAASGFPFPDYIFVACVWRCKWRLMKASLGNLHHVILLLKTVFPFRMSHHCFLVFVCISFCFKWFTLPATAVWVSISFLSGLCWLYVPWAPFAPHTAALKMLSALDLGYRWLLRHSPCTVIDSVIIFFKHLLSTQKCYYLELKSPRVDIKYSY